ncbi:MAG: PD40 domain-containing protein [Acidobacteria bacterium]|nr:PD40 domain-containing protein [Acidobacteriota bacterium]
MSLDGRYVVFESHATNLVPGDTNGVADVFVRDRSGGTVSRVSVAADGGQADARSLLPAISLDGRYVAFESDATNLVEEDTNGASDIFVRDMQTGGIERVSVSSAGQEGNERSMRPAISGDGRRVAFESWASNLVPGPTYSCPEETYPLYWKCSDVFVRDLEAGTTMRVFAPPSGDDGKGEGNSGSPAISADGRVVAFDSSRSDLVEGDTNNTYDVFVHDLQTGGIERVSVSSNGEEGNGLSAGPSLSGDGRYVAFWSHASNLVLTDINHCERYEHPLLEVAGWRFLSRDSCMDVFLRDRASGTTTMVSVSPLGLPGDFDSYTPSITLDGRYVAFSSEASNLVQGDTGVLCGEEPCPEVFVRDMVAGTTERVSVSSTGGEANQLSWTPDMKAERYVVFGSRASNLVEGDTNGWPDIFLRDRSEQRTEMCT